jgi:hypothetical protein
MQVNMVIIVRCAAKVNIVIQMMLQIPVFSAQRENTKIKWAKLFVFRVYQERMKMIPVQPNVKFAIVGNIKMHLAMKRVWIVVLDNT